MTRPRAEAECLETRRDHLAHAWASLTHRWWCPGVGPQPPTTGARLVELVKAELGVEQLVPWQHQVLVQLGEAIDRGEEGERFTISLSR